MNPKQIQYIKDFVNQKIRLIKQYFQHTPNFTLSIISNLANKQALSDLYIQATAFAPVPTYVIEAIKLLNQYLSKPILLINDLEKFDEIGIEISQSEIKNVMLETIMQEVSILSFEVNIMFAQFAHNQHSQEQTSNTNKTHTGTKANFTPCYAQPNKPSAHNHSQSQKSNDNTNRTASNPASSTPQHQKPKQVQRRIGKTPFDVTAKTGIPLVQEAISKWYDKANEDAAGMYALNTPPTQQQCDLLEDIQQLNTCLLQIVSEAKPEFTIYADEKVTIQYKQDLAYVIDSIKEKHSVLFKNSSSFREELGIELKISLLAKLLDTLQNAIFPQPRHYGFENYHSEDASNFRP